MTKLSPDSIPANIRAAAERAGLRVPLWICGTAISRGRSERKKTFEDLVADAAREERDQ